MTEHLSATTTPARVEGSDPRAIEFRSERGVRGRRALGELGDSASPAAPSGRRRPGDVASMALRSDVCLLYFGLPRSAAAAIHVQPSGIRMRAAGSYFGTRGLLWPVWGNRFMFKSGCSLEFHKISPRART